MLLRLGCFGLLLSSLMLTWSCSDDAPAAKEPVAADQKMDKAPDAPGGDSGEAATKPAGMGTAEAPAAAPAPAEKSEPAMEAAKEAVAATAQFVVKPKQLNVRKGPSTKEPVVRTLAHGEKVDAVSCEKHWCKLSENEYVSQKYLKKAN